MTALRQKHALETIHTHTYTDAHCCRTHNCPLLAVSNIPEK